MRFLRTVLWVGAALLLGFSGLVLNQAAHRLPLEAARHDRLQFLLAP
jgi:hypothetical protein